VRPGAVNRALAIKDVALSEGQAFHGVVLGSTGQPAADTRVSITQMGHEVASTTTDEQGRFAFQGLRGGLHVVNAGEASALYRLWSAGTAPPHAQGGVTLVDQVTVRGQRPFRELFTSNAFVVGGIVVAAIAIPIAVHDARNDKKSGS
jgi:hypothetical protein